MEEEKLVGYIKGEINSELEILEILNWIESSPENQRTYTRLKNLWVFTGLDHPEPVKIPAFKFPEGKLIYFQKSRMKSLSMYAAIFVLAFALGSVTLYLINRKGQNQLSSLYNTIEVPYGERSTVTLYDGTKVWLNSGTKFRYPVAFSSKTRNVYVEGEAYLNVAKDAKHPFIVTAGQLQIRVLGTHFDVCAYPDDNEFSATLVEGAINALNTNSGKRVKLAPGEQVVLNRRTNGMEHLQVNTDIYTSWKENLLRFEDAPFDEVIKKMERWYDVKIKVDPAIDTQERYTMTIKTESLREMLQLVSKTTPMKYEIKANVVLLKTP